MEVLTGYPVSISISSCKFYVLQISRFRKRPLGDDTMDKNRARSACTSSPWAKVKGRRRAENIGKAHEIHGTYHGFR